MVEIRTHNGADGYRTYITQGRKTIVLDGQFGPERADTRTSRYCTPYLYGT
jgi:hypothetical protein